MKITPLCKLAYQYGTDKCPQIRHSYTPIYYDLFKDRAESIKKVLEMGIGPNKEFKNKDVVYNKRLKVLYHKGASLKMWRDFFPNAQIYGGDIVPESLFEDERIKTFLCDEREKEDLEKLIENTGGDIDIFIDDASHRSKDQIFMAKTLLPLLKKDVVYVIEDVDFSRRLMLALSEYDCTLPYPSKKELPKSKLVIVKNKV